MPCAPGSGGTSPCLWCTPCWQGHGLWSGKPPSIHPPRRQSHWDTIVYSQSTWCVVCRGWVRSSDSLWQPEEEGHVETGWGMRGETMAFLSLWACACACALGGGGDATVQQEPHKALIAVSLHCSCAHWFQSHIHSLDNNWKNLLTK